MVSTYVTFKKEDESVSESVAEMVVNGEVCQMCMAPIDEPTGVPTTCRDCKPKNGAGFETD